MNFDFIKPVFASCKASSTNCSITSPFPSISLSTIFKNAFTVFYFIVGLVFFILIIISGIRIIVSSGDREKVQKAKKTLTAAIVGLVIIVLAGIIAQIIGGLLGSNFSL